MSTGPALLLVDDRPENLVALEAALEPLAHPMVRANSGEEALRHLLTGDFAVIVLDVQMPGLDGFATAEQIKQRDQSRDIPIVFLTAISREAEHCLRGFDVGAVDYVFKPVEPALLRAKIEVFFELQVNTRLLQQQRAQLAAEVAERQEAEVRLARKSAELARSNADLEQFASVASHDLQEPLHVIAGFVDLLGERLGDRLDDTSRAWMGVITSATDRMNSLIRDLLEYARAGVTPPEPSTVELGDAVQVALDNLAWAIDETGAKVEAGELGQAHASVRELTQVFQNLIANALKFRGERSPVVKLSVSRDGDLVTVAISDNGRGVAAEDLERVFEMFERLDGEARPGTGLGLAMCRKLVERSGGKIWMERNRRGGVTVRFTLPAPRP